MSDNTAESGDARLKLTVTVDGVEYELLPDMIPNRIELELYQQAHLTVAELMAADPWPRFMVASAVFLARRCRGDVVTWDQIADAIKFDTVGELTVDVIPKAPAVS